jgi:tRNA-dihydrouridine synthase
LYKGAADWTLIGKVKNNPRIHIPIFGNGDVDTPEKALDLKARFGVDGIMIGRASIGYPWIFNEIKHFRATGSHLPPPDIDQRVDTCKAHLDYSIRWKGDFVGIVEMRRHYTNYFKGFDHFKAYRTRLVTCPTYTGVLEILEEVRERFRNHAA